MNFKILGKLSLNIKIICVENGYTRKSYFADVFQYKIILFKVLIIERECACVCLAVSTAKR